MAVRNCALESEEILDMMEKILWSETGRHPAVRQNGKGAACFSRATELTQDGTIRILLSA